MTKKPKPRPVQAPKRRVEPSPVRRVGRGVVIIATLLLLLVAALAVILLRSGAGDDAETSAAGASSACQAKTIASQGQQHAEALPENYRYRSFPATSGTHDPVPAVWGSYTEPIEEFKLVHNLEHGGVVIQYGSAVSPELRQEIESWYQDDPYGVVVAPLPKLNNKVAATAWTRVTTCTGFDEDAISSFRDEYRARGPEAFPLEALAPGT